MNGPVLLTINAQLILFFNGADRHDGTIITYAEVDNLLLRLYATGTFIVRANEQIRSLKRTR